MCGINGIIDYHKHYLMEERNKLVHQMNEKIIYRGPNMEGLFDSEHVTMGMRRLSIIDLSTGRQPIYNEDKTLAIVFNGEIYNFKRLREELIQKGHQFYTSADTEVIVHAYEEFGNQAFDRLDGMFSFAIFDSRQNKVVIARDRMGEKPLYFYYNEDYFVFGSELKSLLSTGIVPKVIDKKALNQYLQLTYIPAPLTIFEHVKKVKPAHYMEITLDGAVTEHNYWNYPKTKFSEKDLSYQEAKNKLYTLLEQSVKDRMVSDVPLGAFLSGGIDSSIIVGLMSKLSEQPVETFTIGFDEKEYDERDRAKMVADLNKTNHHAKVLDYKDALSLINHILMKMDEPFADSSVLPSYFVSEFAGEHVKVVLTGDAGDEMFMGYSKYLIDYYSRKYKKVPKFLRKGIIEPVVYHLPDNRAITRKIRKVIDNAEKDLFEQRKALMSLGFKKQERKQLLQDSYYDETCMEFLKDIYEENSQDDEVSKTQKLDARVVLEGDMFTKVDRMSMLNSIETRTPLVSRDIVEFAMQLPSSYKIKEKNLKRILKDAFVDILPENFDKYPKSGFAVPLDYWFRNELKEELTNLLNEEVIKNQGIFDYEYIHTIIEEHLSGRKNRKSELWTLYVFEKWYQHVME